MQKFEIITIGSSQVLWCQGQRGLKITDEFHIYTTGASTMLLIVLNEFFAGLNIQTLDRILSDHSLTGTIHTTVNDLLTILRLRVSDMWALVSDQCNCGLYKRLGLALITAFTRILLLAK